MFGKTRRQAYFDHNSRASDDQLQEALIIELVRSVREVLPRVGGKKLLFILREDFAAHHILIGRDRFFKLLRKHELLVKNQEKVHADHYVKPSFQKLA